MNIKSYIPLLERILDYARPLGDGRATTLEYIPPAQAMRNAADRMERQESDMVSFKNLLEEIKDEKD